MEFDEQPLILAYPLVWEKFLSAWKRIVPADFTESIVPSKEANIMKWVLHSCRTRHI